MKSEKLLTDFINYCKNHKNERFWQALRNWSGASFIFYDKSDTFYWEDINNLSEKVYSISDKKGDYMTAKELMNKYPKLFKQKDLSMKQTCMCFGIECGDGWIPIIDFLCDQLQWDIDNNDYPQVEFTQVKEKYGGLRLYYTHTEDCVYDKEKAARQGGMISIIEQLSNYICERCGSSDRVTQTKGWITSLCYKCMEERNENNNGR